MTLSSKLIPTVLEGAITLAGLARPLNSAVGRIPRAGRQRFLTQAACARSELRR